MPKVKRLLTIVLLAAAAGLLLVAVTIRVVENRLIYFPPRYPQGFNLPQTRDIQVADIWLLTADGVKINGYFHPNHSSRQVLLWFHGNAENIGYGLLQMKELAQIGVSIMAVDYRGYGKSAGRPDEAGVYRDADAAYDYLIAQRHYDPHDIFIYGHSLGGAVAVNLASRRPCGGLIVQSSFTSVRDMARRMFPIPLIALVVKSRFDSVQRIRNVRAPILIVHGTGDRVVPFAMGQRLFAAAPEPKSFYPIEGAGHNDVLEAGGEAYLARLKVFVQSSAQGGHL